MADYSGQIIVLQLKEDGFQHLTTLRGHQSESQGGEGKGHDWAMGGEGKGCMTGQWEGKGKGCMTEQ